MFIVAPPALWGLPSIDTLSYRSSTIAKTEYFVLHFKETARCAAFNYEHKFLISSTRAFGTYVSAIASTNLRFLKNVLTVFTGVMPFL